MNVPGSGRTKLQSSQSDQISEDEIIKKKVKKVSSSSENPHSGHQKKDKKNKKDIKSKKIKKALKNGKIMASYRHMLSPSSHRIQKLDKQNSNKADNVSAFDENTVLAVSGKKRNVKKRNQNGWTNLVRRAFNSASNQEDRDFKKHHEINAMESCLFSYGDLQTHIDICRTEIDSLMDKIKKTNNKHEQKKEIRLITAFKKKLTELDYLARKLADNFSSSVSKKSSKEIKNPLVTVEVADSDLWKKAYYQVAKPVFSSTLYFSLDTPIKIGLKKSYKIKNLNKLEQAEEKIEKSLEIPKLIFSPDSELENEVKPWSEFNYESKRSIDSAKLDLPTKNGLTSKAQSSESKPIHLDNNLDLDFVITNVEAEIKNLCSEFHSAQSQSKARMIASQIKIAKDKLRLLKIIKKDKE